MVDRIGVGGALAGCGDNIHGAVRQVQKITEVPQVWKLQDVQSSTDECGGSGSLMGASTESTASRSHTATLQLLDAHTALVAAHKTLAEQVANFQSDLADEKTSRGTILGGASEKSTDWHADSHSPSASEHQEANDVETPMSSVKVAAIASPVLPCDEADLSQNVRSTPAAPAEKIGVFRTVSELLAVEARLRAEQPFAAPAKKIGVFRTVSELLAFEARLRSQQNRGAALQNGRRLGMSDLSGFGRLRILFDTQLTSGCLFRSILD